MIEIDNYQITDTIYETLSSLVLRARGKMDNELVFLKVLKKNHQLKDGLLQLEAEYNIIKNLDIPGIIKCTEIKKIGDTITVVMENFNGVLLDEYLSSVKPGINDLLKIAIDITKIINDIHKYNIIHKDIKPASILINPQTHEIKITNFSLAVNAGQSEQINTSQDKIDGTLSYISPEQTGRMNRKIDMRSDLYSLGVTLYEMFTGRLPFEYDDPSEIIHSHIARRPVPPAEVCEGFPEVLSDIIIKLMAKSSADRYQCTEGVLNDLNKCYISIIEKGVIDRFTVGEFDYPENFKIPDKIYGRDDEKNIILSDFFEASAGRNKNVFLSGPHGIGKTFLINNLQEIFLNNNGYFITGNFDRNYNEIPYNPFIQAYRDLCRRILTESDEDISFWREIILKSIGSYGEIIINIIPEVEHIIGVQPRVQDIPVTEARNQFLFIFQKFMKCFGREGRTVVLFLDDLQWADNASLNLLNEILKDRDLKHYLLIGAYRDNEFIDARPLVDLFNRLWEDGLDWRALSLKPLNLKSIQQLISNTVKHQTEEVKDLACIVAQKTGSNPMFVKEFLINLYKNKLIFFRDGWHYNIYKIKNSEITGNMADIMQVKLNSLDDNTSKILYTASCIGMEFNTELLSDVHRIPENEIIELLEPAIREGLLIKLEGNYKFSHDKVRGLVYGGINKKVKRLIHYDIGQYMLSGFSLEKKENLIFELVHHFNRSLGITLSKEEKITIAGLNLKAASRAKLSGAFEEALFYIKKGVEFLPIDSWSIAYELTLEIFTLGCVSGYMASSNEMAEFYYNLVKANARSILDKIPVYESRINACAVIHKTDEALNTGREALKLLGVNMPWRAVKLHTARELFKAKLKLQKKGIENILDLPRLNDKNKEAVARILMACTEPCYIGYPEYFPVIVLKILNLSFRYGNSPYAAYAYAIYAIILCGGMGKFEEGYRFGRLSLRVLEKFNAPYLKSKIYFIFGSMIYHWKGHLRGSMTYLMEGFNPAPVISDLSYSSYCLNFSLFNYFFMGYDLQDVKNGYQSYNDRMRLFAPRQLFRLSYQLVINLLEGGAGDLDIQGDIINEKDVVPGWIKVNQYSDLGIYTVLKQVLLFYRSSYGEAIRLSYNGYKYLDSIISTPFVPYYYFYFALSLIFNYWNTGLIEKWKYRKKIKSIAGRFRKYAECSPENYENKYLIIKAWLSGIRGNFEKTINIYDRAVTRAGKSGFLPEEALANEMAADYCLSRSMEFMYKIYMEKAYSLFEAWGLKSKVTELIKKYPVLAYKADNRKKNIPGVPDITGQVIPLSPMDFASVLKSSRAISEEIILEKLLGKLLRIMMENAGASRGVLIIKNNKELHVKARGNIDEDETEILEGLPLSQCGFVPVTIIRYVDRLNEAVVLNDASRSGFFFDDRYDLPGSVICVPVIHKQKLTAIVYLENNFILGAFTQERQVMLKVLASQAAISLENALLYDNLAKEIAERKKVEDSLNIYKHIVSSSNDIMLFIDSNYIFRAVNEEFMKLFGKELADIIGTSAEDIFGLKYLQESLAGYLKKCFAGSVQSFEEWFVFPQTGHRYMEINLYPFIDSSGEISGVIMNLRDSTDRLKMEKSIVDLREKERHRLGMELHDGLSHYLLGIAIRSRMLAENLKDKSMDEASLAFEIENRINRAIEETRSLARGVSPVSIEEINISEILDEKRKLLEEKKAIKCSVKADEDIQIIDRTIIVQIYFIIQEAVNNIIKHSEARNVEINLTSRNKIISLSIKDDGTGIKDQDVQYGGMGLNIIKYRARSIGAALEIKSGKGKGTEILCKLKME